MVPVATFSVKKFVRSVGFKPVVDILLLIASLLKLDLIASLLKAFPVTSLDATDCKVSPAKIWSVVSFLPLSANKDLDILCSNPFSTKACLPTSAAAVCVAAAAVCVAAVAAACVAVAPVPITAPLRPLKALLMTGPNIMLKAMLPRNAPILELKSFLTPFFTFLPTFLKNPILFSF